MIKVQKEEQSANNKVVNQVIDLIEENASYWPAMRVDNFQAIIREYFNELSDDNLDLIIKRAVIRGQLVLEKDAWGSPIFKQGTNFPLFDEITTKLKALVSTDTNSHNIPKSFYFVGAVIDVLTDSSYRNDQKDMNNDMPSATWLFDSHRFIGIGQQILSGGLSALDEGTETISLRSSVNINGRTVFVGKNDIDNINLAYFAFKLLSATKNIYPLDNVSPMRSLLIGDDGSREFEATYALPFLSDNASTNIEGVSDQIASETSPEETYIRGDIKNCYPSIDPEQWLRSLVKDNLVSQQDCDKFLNLVKKCDTKGLPIIGTLSSFFFNLKMNHEFEQGFNQIPQTNLIARYMDDFVVETTSSQSKQALSQIKTILAENGLTLNIEKSWIANLKNRQPDKCVFLKHDYQKELNDKAELLKTQQQETSQGYTADQQPFQ